MIDSFGNPDFDGFNYYVGGTSFGEVNVYSDAGIREVDGSSISVSYSAFISSTPVPFDIPGGATIPTVGSLFALGLMRKAKKRLAAKTLVINPVETVVS